MGYEKDALNNVRKKLAEVVKKEGQKIVVGWTPEQKEAYKEGDVWDDNDGKQWTIKNGIKQSISKLESARMPMFCPFCKKTMSGRINTKFWRLRGKCEDCVLKEEVQIRLSGDWEQYELVGELRNQIAFLQDQIIELISYRDALSQPEIIHADDEKILMVEKWTVDLNKVRKDMNDDIERLDIILDKTIKELKKVEHHGN
jgi:hypothetical protein